MTGMGMCLQNRKAIATGKRLMYNALWRLCAWIVAAKGVLVMRRALP